MDSSYMVGYLGRDIKAEATTGMFNQRHSTYTKPSRILLYIKYIHICIVRTTKIDGPAMSHSLPQLSRSDPTQAGENKVEGVIAESIKFPLGSNEGHQGGWGLMHQLYMAMRYMLPIRKDIERSYS